MTEAIAAEREIGGTAERPFGASPLFAGAPGIRLRRMAPPLGWPAEGVPMVEPLGRIP